MKKTKRKFANLILFGKKVWLLIMLALCSEVTYAQYSLYVGEAQFLSPPNTEGYIDYASWHASNSYVNFTTADAAGAIVELTGYFQGTATVTMTYTERYFNKYTNREQARTGTKSYSISCKPVSIILGESALEMKPDQTKRLSYKWSPTGHSSKARIEWKSDDSSVATVEGGTSTYNTYATITAKKAGTATITAITNLGPSASCTVTVKPIDPDQVSLPSTATTRVGESITLTPTLSPSDAQTTYVWKSENTTVASVSSNGVVTGKKTGTARITVTTANGKTDACMVTVEKGNLTLTTDIESGIIYKGTKVKLTVNRSDAEIYYTLDGKTPTSSSTRYTGPIAINEDLTLKAIAMGSEYNPSDMVTRTFQVTALKVTDYTPSQNSTSKEYTVEPSIKFNEEISKGSKFSSITFQWNNSEVMGDIIIDGSVLRFKPKNSDLPNGTYVFNVPEGALKNKSGEPNLEVKHQFTIDCTQLTITSDIGGGVVKPGTTLSLTPSVPSAKIYYTTDGSKPSVENSLLYTGPITIDKSMQISAMAVLEGYRNSGNYGFSFSVSNLSVVESDMNGNNPVFSPTFIPSITFNSNICKGYNFYGIELEGYGYIKGDVLIVGNTLYFVPEKELTPRVYVLKIPANALVNEANEPNFEQEYRFRTAYRNSVKNISGTHHVQIEAGDYYSMYLNDFGELFTWGNNDHGQLGDGTTENREKPQIVADNVKLVATSMNSSNSAGPSTFVIKNDGSLWGWGENGKYQIGNGKSQDQLVPYKIMEGVSSVFPNRYRTFAVKTNGTLYGWGTNPNGEIIAENTYDYKTPTQVLTNVSSVVTKDYMTFALKKDNSLWVWGENYYGSLGTGKYDSWGRLVDTYEKKPTQILAGVSQVSAGVRSGLALKSNASLWGWGLGELGLGDEKERRLPVQVATDVKYVTCSIKNYATFIIKNDNSLWACGSNYDGQLGDGTTTDRQRFVKIMTDVKDIAHLEYNGYALKTDNTLWAWGRRDYGALGDGGNGHLSPVKVLSDVATFSAATDHVLAIKNDGSVWIWGGYSSYYGIKGSTHTPQMIFAPYSIRQELTGIAMAHEATTIHMGQKGYIPVNMNPITADYKTISYACSDEQIATVSDRGVVTPLKTGSVDITVKVDGKYTAICKVTILEAYNVNIAKMEHGHVDWSEDKNRDHIKVKFVPDENYHLDTWSITDSYGKDVSAEDYGSIVYFPMPNSDVTVSATFAPDVYNVVIAASEHGKIASLSTIGMFDEEIKLTITPESGYMLDTLSIRDTDGKAVDYQHDGQAVTFVMPASNVTVSATFVEATMTVRTSNAGYATFFDSQWAVTLPSGLKAQVVTSASNGKLIYQTLTGDVVPQSVAVMLSNGEKRSADYILTRTESTTAYTGTNLLHGSDEATMTTGDGLHYKLTFGPSSDSKLKNVFGWYWGASDGMPFQIEGHKAWLVVPQSAAKRAAAFSLEGSVLGISDAEATEQQDGQDVVYDLQGRRMAVAAKKGIYIKNGKKIVNE